MQVEQEGVPGDIGRYLAERLLSSEYRNVTLSILVDIQTQACIDIDATLWVPIKYL